ncbi:MAG: hypothetical protein JXL80_11245 [Planctomycetes bacterium]|nr:hypothetical protein [Planctomycetota bacterium]
MSRKRGRTNPNNLLPQWTPKKRLLEDVPLEQLKPDFRTTYLDFDRGIHMGNLEPNQRITRIVRQALEDRHATRFITDRWGRGVYWHWICWLPVESRKAKPVSNNYNFGCAKYYITLNDEPQSFEAGMQIERASMLRGGDTVCTEDDWDYHTLVRSLRRGSPLADELSRLIREEGFTARAGPFASRRTFTAANYRGPADVARAAKSIPDDEWGGFQLCYVIPRNEIKGMTGDDVVAAILAVFDELVAAMNLVMTMPCLKPPPKYGAQKDGT